MRKKVDRISVWLFRRIPLGALAFIIVYVGLRLADSSGREQWRVEAPKGKPFRTMAVSSAGIHALRVDGLCQTFEIRSGSLLWEARLCESLSYNAELRASNNLLVVTAMEGLWVLDATKGTVLYTREDGPDAPERALILERRLLLADEPGNRKAWRRWRSRDPTNDYEQAAAGDEDPDLTCVDFTSGRVAWTRAFKGRQITKIAGEGAMCFCASEIPESWEWKPCAKHQKARMRYGQECADCLSRCTPASDRRIEAIDCATGITRWHCRLAGGEVRLMRVNGGRLLVLTNHRIYTVDADGREIGRMPWASSNHVETLVLRDRLLEVDMQGGIRAATVTPPAPAWTHSPGGYVREVVADDTAAYVSTVQSGDRQGDGATDPMGQLARELWGDAGDTSAGGPVKRVLTALDPSDGRAKWRREDLLGRFVPYGDMLLRITEGAETSLIFSDGGTVLYAHLARNGRQVWSSKVPFAMSNISLLPDRIVAIVEKHGSELPGSGSAGTSAIASFNRRSLLNRLMRP